ncbi:MAG: formyltransferase family protein [Planctomycetota bacterium]|jgi:methionyl-tRNA formyltransferase
MSQLRLAVFADKEVGYQTLEFLGQSYPTHLVVVFLTESSDIRGRVVATGLNQDLIYSSNGLYGEDTVNLLRKLDLDYILLAWWPYIIKQPILSIPKKGILNYHPSYLPYNRGKHYNFWTLVEETPFGVTIHFVNEGIDSGDIVFQKKIRKNWEDTGESLYWKAQKVMVELFIENYSNLIANKFSRIPQNPEEGGLHYARELEPASEIKLDNCYLGKDILNLIRARVFPPYPSCRFYDKKRKFNITIEIRQVTRNQLSDNYTEILLGSPYKARDLLTPYSHDTNTDRFFHFIDNGRTYEAHIKIAPEKI